MIPTQSTSKHTMNNFIGKIFGRGVLLGSLLFLNQPAKAILPVLSVNNVAGSYTNDPPNTSTEESSFGFAFDLNGVQTIDALGLFAPAVPSWTSGTYEVGLWSYDAADPLNLQPNEITLLDIVKFDAADAATYPVKGGYFWLPIPSLTVTGTPLDPGKGYLISAIGLFTNTPVGQLQYLTGDESMSYGFIYEGNGANDASDTAFWPTTQAPVYPIPNINGYFNPNLSVVPGPLPLLGAASAWSWSRRLRNRIRKSL